MKTMAYVENIVIYVCIAAITVGGVWLTGTWWGLWSLLLMGVVNSPRTPAATKEKSDE